MSSFYVDGQIVGPTFQNGFDLSSILVSVGNRQDDKVVKVQITEPGVYYLSSVLVLKCNLIIEGCEGAVISVKFTSDHDYHDSSTFIHFDYITKTVQGVTTYIRPNIVIKNVEFKIDNNHLWHSTNNRFHYLKFYWAQSIHLDNVKMKLEGQKILINVDMRECENVIIENCMLENYHNNTDLIYEGGILWFRGMTRNIKITNNIIKKSGNDEALGFWGHFSDYHSNEDPRDNYYIIPESEEPSDGICYKENILVQNNVFEYDNHYSNSNTNDCFISLHDLSAGQNTKNVFTNISFKGNTFIIKDLVKRLFFCVNENESTIQDVSFNENNFFFGDFTASMRCHVFELDNKNYNVVSNYHIIGNNVYNKSKFIFDNEPGLFFIIQNGGEALVSNNVVRIYEDSVDEEQIYRKVIFFWVNFMKTKLTVEHNNIEGLYLFGKVSCSSNPGNRMISKMDLLAKENIIKGCSSIYCRNVGELNLDIEGNYIESEAYVIALQEYGTSGKFIYINNHVIIKYTGNSNFYHSSTGCGANQFVFANNVFEKVHNDIMATILGYIDSQHVTNANNIILN